MNPPRACQECLRRAWLLVRLAGHLDIRLWGATRAALSVYSPGVPLPHTYAVSVPARSAAVGVHYRPGDSTAQVTLPGTLPRGIDDAMLSVAYHGDQCRGN